MDRAKNLPGRRLSLKNAGAIPTWARRKGDLGLGVVFGVVIQFVNKLLAKLVGTTFSAICRLENADYEGHSLAMLNWIAAALDQRVELHFVPVSQGKRLKTA